MSALVVGNLGNSDLTADGERPRRPRPEGELLWQQFEAHSFALPLIEPCLAQLLAEGVNITRVVLFYTDQPETEETMTADRFGVRLRDKDTVWYAQIAARLLHERFDARVGSVELRRVERGNGEAINPSLYDEAFDAYGDLIARAYLPDDTSCFVLMAGGIPACNSALQLHALGAYADRCRFVYQPEGGHPYELRVGAQLQATFRRATALDALARHDFATALHSVETLERPDPALLALLRYACYREAFDFVRARVALGEGLRAASGRFRIFLDTLKPDLEQLVERTDSAALLLEVYASARITWDNQRYADFLGRIFRFQEATLRHIVETRLELPTDMGATVQAPNLARYQAGIAASPALQVYLDAQRIDERPLRYADGPNRTVMSAMLSFLAAGGVRADGRPYLEKAELGRFGELRRRLNKLENLAQLRNQSIIAHGFAGVSREELDRAYGGEAVGIMQDLAKVLELLGLGQAASPFDRIAEAAAESLRRAAR